MNRLLTFVPVLLCAGALVTAQQPAQEKPAGGPPPTATQAPAPPAAQAPAAKEAAAGKVTYSGCIKPGSAPDSWILESAELSKPGGGASVGTSGAMKTTLALSAKSGTDLKPHANHKVEIVGSVAPAKAGGGDAPKQELTVDSLKMVSTTCP
jgi:hypothetical protein